MQKLAHSVGGQRSTFLVIGGNEADDLLRFEPGINYNRRNAGLRCLFHRTHQRMTVKRRQHNALYALADKALDHLGLLLAVILPQGALPDNVDVSPRLREVLHRLHRSRVNRLPVLVGRALRDHCDGEALLSRIVFVASGNCDRESKGKYEPT